MNNDSLLPMLTALLKQFYDGLSVTELQVKLYSHFKLKMSYREIESNFFCSPELFREDEGKWKLR
jgi:hypothetical protein